MVEFLNTRSPDEVIAVGGGSVLDAAKAAWAVYQSGIKLENLFGVDKISGTEPAVKLKKVICIPTTSGTGSEATPYSNIVDYANSVKRLITDPELIPEYSFLIPDLTVSMPEHVTIATACDAMAHSLEGFLNVRQDAAHPSANSWALQSVKLVVENLPRVLQEPENIEARTALAVASCLGGMVIRYKSTGLPHLCSFSWFGHIEHGIAVSILLPHALDYYIQSTEIRQRVMKLQDIFPGDSPSAIISSYRNFLSECGVPASLKAFPGITKELLDATAKNAGQNKMKLELAPKPVPLENSYEILSKILCSAFI
jgi:alcohol dehydrogenase class IV